jgi:hypothetical protein
LNDILGLPFSLRPVRRRGAQSSVTAPLKQREKGFHFHHDRAPMTGTKVLID